MQIIRLLASVICSCCSCGMRSWNIIQYLFCCWHKDQNYGIILPICQCNVNPFFVLSLHGRHEIAESFPFFFCVFRETSLFLLSRNRPGAGVAFEGSLAVQSSAGLDFCQVSFGRLWEMESQFSKFSQTASWSGIRESLFCNLKILFNFKSDLI